MLNKIKRISAQTWIFALFCAINMALVMGILFTQGVRTTVRGSSMNPTMKHGSSYLAVKSQSLQFGDIVIADSNAFDTKIIKRIIAVPGDTLAITNNVVYRNGAPLTEDYIAEPMLTEDIPEIRLGEGQYFLMGDNRNHSADSRVVGLISRDEILYVVPMENQPFLLVRWVAMLVLFVFGAVAVSEAEALGLVNSIAYMKSKKKEVNANA